MATLGLFCMTVYPMQVTAVAGLPAHQSRHFHGYERLQGYWALRLYHAQPFHSADGHTARTLAKIANVDRSFPYVNQPSRYGMLQL